MQYLRSTKCQKYLTFTNVKDHLPDSFFEALFFAISTVPRYLPKLVENINGSSLLKGSLVQLLMYMIFQESHFEVTQ